MMSSEFVLPIFYKDTNRIKEISYNKKFMNLNIY